MSPTGQAEKGPAEYGREALSQWAEAARLIDQRFGSAVVVERIGRRPEFPSPS